MRILIAFILACFVVATPSYAQMFGPDGTPIQGLLSLRCDELSQFDALFGGDTKDADRNLGAFGLGFHHGVAIALFAYTTAHPPTDKATAERVWNAYQAMPLSLNVIAATIRAQCSRPENKRRDIVEVLAIMTRPITQATESGNTAR